MGSTIRVGAGFYRLKGVSPVRVAMLFLTVRVCVEGFSYIPPFFLFLLRTSMT
jgi:hypothetical protein